MFMSVHIWLLAFWSFIWYRAVRAAAVRKTVKGAGWTYDGLSALLYMCTESHVIPSKGLLVLWISVLERLSNRQKEKEASSILLDRLHSLPCPLILSTHASLLRCMQEICPKLLLNACGRLWGVIVLRHGSNIILASQQVSLKWPACRGHLTVLRGAAGCWGWASAWLPVKLCLSLMS